MACPFFHPVERFQDGAWLKPPRLPLGDPCRGECQADPAAPAEPTLDELRQYCNLGYARGHCVHFPAEADVADAVRFSITRDQVGAISLVYVLEKNYGPLQHGPLVFDTLAAEFTEPMESPMLRAQARQFIDSYLNRSRKA